MKTISIIVLSVFLISCASGTYTAPEGTKRITNYTIVNRSFNQVWSNLIEHLASTYFGIESFEKESGLIILTFGASNPSDFIRGGNYSVNTMAIQYDGEYVDYLTTYFSCDFIAKMNIVVKAESETQTKVTVNARYVFSSQNTQTGEKNTWSFNTNSEGKQKIKNSADKSNIYRTLVPTYRAELDILKMVDRI